MRLARRNLHRIGKQWSWRALAVMAVWIAGCREELGPVHFPTSRVQGVIRVGTRPLGGGWVELTPIRGTVGNMRTAPIARDGSFQVDRVPVGKIAIGVMNAPIDPVLLAQFHPLHDQPVQRTIVRGDSNRLEIDLLEEILRRRHPSR